jgi:UPF0716 protein FxsA
MRNLFLFLLGAIIVIPALEIWLFIEIGGWIGALPTIMLVFLSAVLGAYFARREGWNTYRLAMIQMQNGELPGEALLDGACILSGGILLITPGFFTDAAGFLLVFPYTRAIVKHWIIRWLKKKFERGEIIWYRRY